MASTGKLDLVRDLGADHVVDYTRDDPVDGTRHHDVIIDTGGNTPLRRALTPTGTLVIVGGEGGGRWLGGLDRQARAMLLSRFTRQRLTAFVASEDAAHLDRLARLVDDGPLTPVVDRTFPLAHTPDAIRHLESGHVRGKAVVTVATADAPASALAVETTR